MFTKWQKQAMPFGHSYITPEIQTLIKYCYMTEWNYFINTFVHWSCYFGTRLHKLRQNNCQVPYCFLVKLLYLTPITLMYSCSLCSTLNRGKGLASSHASLFAPVSPSSFFKQKLHRHRGCRLIVRANAVSTLNLLWLLLL